MIDNIKIGNQIGRGVNGRILEAKWEGIVIAVKSIFMNEASDLEFQSFKRSFLRECEQSSRLRHPNIVRFFGIYHPPGARVPSLVMERLHCSLTSLLENNPVVPIGTKIWIIKDVALGLRYLHTRNPPIIHRDLSSNTVEPLNNGHFGTSNFWHNFTVIERLSSFRGKIVLPWSCRDQKNCPL